MINESYYASPKDSEVRITKDADLDFLGKQVFIVDPRGQGFGLQNYDFLDAYANKFLILASPQGIFVSPKSIPQELLTYYDELGVGIPSPGHILAFESGEGDSTLIDRLAKSPEADFLFSQQSGKYVVPYMVTPKVEDFGRTYGLSFLVDAVTVSHMGDKAKFQEELHAVSADIVKDTGYDIAIPGVSVTAADRTSLEREYRALSHSGTKAVVVVRPKSASGLGVFILSPGQGVKGLRNILAEHFDDAEEVLLEEFVEHNHSPSMQGVRTPATDYKHLYFGRQVISVHDDRISYDSSQIPFGPETVVIAPQDLARMQDVHQSLGEALIQRKGIAGVAGFDTVADISPDGGIERFKVTELNLHLPSSLAVYAAINKVFPDGFGGTAHNLNIPLRPGESPQEFIKRNRALLVSKKQAYGMFPLNLSYSDKADVVFFAKDAEHLNQLTEGVQL